MKTRPNTFDRLHHGHTMIELVVAMVASAMLLASLGSVMLIARQIAFTPSAPTQRMDAAGVVNELAGDLRFATLLVEQSPTVLDFVVADRDGDGAAERIRYEWSGTAGDPLTRTYNGASPITILNSVQEFQITPTIASTTTTLETTVTSGEVFLASNTNVQSGSDRGITATAYSAQQINPIGFASIPANALSWSATKVEFQGRGGAGTSDTLLVQLHSSGDPHDGPTSHVLSQATVPESTLTGGTGWNTAIFPDPARGLALHRRYAVTWSGVGNGIIAKLLYNDSAAGGVLESEDAGASWQYMTSRQMYYRLYGTYTTPGPQYDVTRSVVPHVRIVLRTGASAHSRVDASIPLVNTPELLTAYWRMDFDSDPTATDGDGDGVPDWAQTGGGSFVAGDLIDDVWFAGSALETRPLNDFAGVTTVDVRCRNTGIGGNGAVVRINADRQAGLHAPLLFYLQLQSNGTQTLTLYGKTSDAANIQLFKRKNLSNDFVRFRLTIVPASDVVNVEINGEDQGTFAYPIYPPSSTDRFLTLYADTSAAQFDYVEVRVAEN